MGRGVRIVLWSIGVLLALTVIVVVVARILMERERESIYHTAWVTLRMAEPMDELTGVTFSFCGEEHHYSRAQLADTTGENMVIGGKDIPCLVNARLEYGSDMTRTLHVDSFDCRRCSGGHAYTLYKDSVAYRYWP
jgi:hypothetical protein